MRRFVVVARTVFVAAFVTSCTDTPTIAVKARFYNGATPAAPGSANLRATIAPVGGGGVSVVPANGAWLLSPDVVGLTATHIALTGGPSNGTELHCPVAFSRASAGLTQLNECPFNVPAGTYSGVAIAFSAVYSVTINDATNGFYSTSSGIQTTAPAGGASALLVTHIDASVDNGELTVQIPLASPLTITDTSTVGANILINGLQFFHVTVSGSTVSLGWAGTSYVGPFFPDIVASAGAPAKVAFYSRADLNTTGSFCAGGSSCPVPSPGFTSMSVYYNSATSVSAVGIGINGNSPSCDPIGVGFVNDSRSYLGRDASGNIGWAEPTTDKWTAYSTVMRMAEVTTVGGSTTLYCKAQSTDPAPPGGSFSSGAPNIATAGNSVANYILLAK